jgi:hypothetical protein
MLSEPSYKTAATSLGAQVRAEIASGALLAELEGLPTASFQP